jgi:hypothetical protein
MPPSLFKFGMAGIAVLALGGGTVFVASQPTTTTPVVTVYKTPT